VADYTVSRPLAFIDIKSALIVAGRET